MMHQKVHVPIPDRAYDVVIGTGLIDEAGALVAPFLHRPRVAIVTDGHVEAAQLQRLKASLAAEAIDCAHLSLPPGESTKSWAHLGETVEWLLAQKLERRDIVVALGGGVIGDLAGFAAAVLRRGVRFVQVPTSLLAQVDSSVGGKTGINSPLGKNLIGAFHQPALVLADLDALDSLPDRQMASGYGEVMKYGLLGDAAFFEWLENNGRAVLARDKEALAYAVARSVEMKAEIVVEDETEQGRRALLNLGHTFCHALEAATGYSDRLLHGEGVAIGCGLAFGLSARMGLVSQEDPARVYAHLQDLGMKAHLRDIEGALPDAAALVALMGQDKKVLDGQIRFILARAIGEAFVSSDVEADDVVAFLSDQG